METPNKKTPRAIVAEMKAELRKYYPGIDIPIKIVRCKNEVILQVEWYDGLSEYQVNQLIGPIGDGNEVRVVLFRHLSDQSLGKIIRELRFLPEMMSALFSARERAYTLDLRITNLK